MIFDFKGVAEFDKESMNFGSWIHHDQSWESVGDEEFGERFLCDDF